MSKKKKARKVQEILPDEISGDCGEDPGPLEITEAGESSLRAYLVAKKTWQRSVACDETSYLQDNESLSYLLFENQKDVEEQYNDEVHELHFESLKEVVAYTATTTKKTYLDIMEILAVMDSPRRQDLHFV